RCLVGFVRGLPPFFIPQSCYFYYCAGCSPLLEPFAGCRLPLEIPLLRCSGTIRRQAQILGKQVRATRMPNLAAFSLRPQKETIIPKHLHGPPGGRGARHDRCEPESVC